MEDVVLHCLGGSGWADGLGSLVERTERLLEPFPLRPPPVFRPWFPDFRPPLRPARPAPVIRCSADALPENKHRARETEESPPGKTPRSGDVPDRLLPPPEKRPRRDDVPPVRRSWSVLTPGGVPPPAPPSQALSRQFRLAVSTHRLHLRQRAKWVIGEGNCGTSRDIEQAWRTLSRSSRGSGLPACNAHIQRERAEIWVFCDVLQAEQVGRLLKARLQLSGTIVLTVHRLGHVFSM